MLGEIEAKVGQCAITAKPMSWLRGAFFDFLPYIQGQKVRFRIVITALVDLPTDTNFTYSVETNVGQMSWRYTIKQKPMQLGEKVVWVSERIPLYRTGDSLFTVWESNYVDERQGAFIFHTTSRNTVFLTVLGIIVTAVVAVITIA